MLGTPWNGTVHHCSSKMVTFVPDTACVVRARTAAASHSDENHDIRTQATTYRFSQKGLHSHLLTLEADTASTGPLIP